MVIKIKPLSVNKAWKGRRYKTKLYKQYQKEMMFLLPNINFNFNNKLQINVVFGFSNKTSDVDNPLKPLIDCLQKKYNFDDKQIYKLTAVKELVEKGNEFINIKISEYS